MKKEKYWIKIENDGEIDISGLHLMGVSSKRDEEKIGFFGSGNKYAIALLLRENIPFKIFSGIKEIKITTEPVMFRKQLFNQIVINGEKTSLTTAMGVDWETWFAVREIYCNALDEGNALLTIEKSPKAVKNKTTIFISLTDKLSSFFQDINSYILVSKDGKKEEVQTGYGKVAIYPSNEKMFVCYRKGIRIYPENEQKSLYWYDFENIEINESRVYKYEHEVKERMASFFAGSTNRETVLNYLKNWKENFERDVKWEYVSDKLSEVWHKLLFGKRVYPESLALNSGDFEGKYNSFIVPDKLAEKILKEIDGVEVVGAKQDKKYLEVKATEDEKEKINKSLEELKSIGYNIPQEIKVIVPQIDDVVAWYEKDNDTIYLARKFITTLPYIKNTLLEEFFHSKGLNDGQREFVSYLIDELIRAKEIK